MVLVYALHLLGGGTCNLKVRTVFKFRVFFKKKIKRQTDDDYNYKYNLELTTWNVKPQTLELGTKTLYVPSFTFCGEF